MAEIFYCSLHTSMMFKEIRFQKIQEIIHNDGEAKVEELAEKFSVSEMTIRRDLNTMVQKGLIERTHGGAVLAMDRNLLQSPILMRLFEQATKTAFHNLLGLIALINWMCAENVENFRNLDGLTFVSCIRMNIIIDDALSESEAKGLLYESSSAQPDNF